MATPALGSEGNAAQVSNGEHPSRRPASDSEKRGLGRWFDDAPVLLNLLAVVGLVAYAYLRLAYVFFYRRFGLVPEDVGLGYFEILSQSLLGLLLFMLIILVLTLVILACVVTTVGLMISTGDSATEMFTVLTARPVRRIVLVAILAALLGVAVIGRFEWAITTVAIIAYGGVCAVLTWLTRYRSGRSLELVWRWTPRVVLVSVLAASIIFAPFVYLKQAEADGTAVARGEARHPLLMGWIPLANWGGDRARVLWQRDSAPDGWEPGRNQCLMYLGRTGETTVLFDAASNEILRVPTRTTTIVVDAREAPACAPESI